MKKIYMIICPILLINASLIAQTNQTGLPNPLDDPSDGYAYNAYNGTINSDYGPRHINSATASKFHNGIDYDRNTFEPAWAIEGGTDIQEISISANVKNSNVEVAGWRYVHVFTDPPVCENPPPPELPICDPELYEEFQITRIDGKDFIFIRERSPVVGLQTIHAYVEGRYDGDPYITDPKTSDVVTVESWINQGDLIFRARDYGDPGDKDDHLHIDRGYPPSTNLRAWQNPIYYINNTDNSPPILEVGLKRKNNGTAELFSSNVLWGDVLIQSRVDYIGMNQCDLDVLKIELSDNGGTTFTNEFIWRYTGPEHITVNLTTGEYIGSPEFKIWYALGDNLNSIETDIHEGIFPVGNIPSIEILKHYLETKGDNILNPDKQDGSYQIRVTAADVNSNSSLHSDHSIKIDNYRPFVSRVDVENPSGDVIYSKTWEANGTNLVSTIGGNGHDINEHEAVIVRVWTSEQMTAGSMDITIDEKETDFEEFNNNYWSFLKKLLINPSISYIDSFSVNRELK